MRSGVFVGRDILTDEKIGRCYSFSSSFIFEAPLQAKKTILHKMVSRTHMYGRADIDGNGMDDR